MSTPAADEPTMRFLMNRSALVTLYAKGNHGSEYVAKIDVTHIARGTGVFVERDGHGYLVTNEHVLRPRIRRNDVPISVLVALGVGLPAAEDHEHFVAAAREFTDDGHGNAALSSQGQPIAADPRTDADLGLVALSPDSTTRARAEGKKFVAWSATSRPPAIAEKVCLRGYAAGDVDLLVDIPAVVGDGYSLFADVVGADGNLISIDATEAGICYGAGEVQPDRDLHGISGAGVFDMMGELRAIVWGGDPERKLIYACPVRGLSPLFAELDLKRRTAQG